MAVSSHLRPGSLPACFEKLKVREAGEHSCGLHVGELFLRTGIGRRTRSMVCRGATSNGLSIERSQREQARQSSRRRLPPCAAVHTTVGGLVGTDFSFAVVIARFNDIVTRPLLAGALEAFSRHGVQDENIEVVWVPGSFEIPVVAQAMAKSGKFDAVLCIGAVIRGATTHYDAVAGAASSGILSAGMNSGVPCIMGVLTTESLEQAIDRAGGKLGNKGAEAAVTAVEMASAVRLLKERGSAK